MSRPKPRRSPASRRRRRTGGTGRGKKIAMTVAENLERLRFPGGKPIPITSPATIAMLDKFYNLERNLFKLEKRETAQRKTEVYLYRLGDRFYKGEMVSVREPDYTADGKPSPHFLHDQVRMIKGYKRIKEGEWVEVLLPKKLRTFGPADWHFGKY